MTEQFVQPHTPRTTPDKGSRAATPDAAIVDTATSDVTTPDAATRRAVRSGPASSPGPFRRRTSGRRGLATIATVLGLAGVVVDAGAQTSNLYNRGPQFAGPRLHSWTQQPATPVDPITLHDVVSVRVDELARMTSEGEVQRRKSGEYDAILLDWVKLLGAFAVKPATQSDGDPHVQGTIDQTLRSQSDMETRQSVAFNIACQVVDIRPNGNLVLEGHKEIRVNQDAWLLSLSGECSAKDVGPGRTVLSQDILSMKIDKRERGHIRDGYKRGWFLRWFDEFHPF